MATKESPPVPEFARVRSRLLLAIMLVVLAAMVLNFYLIYQDMAELHAPLWRAARYGLAVPLLLLLAGGLFFTLLTPKVDQVEAAILREKDLHAILAQLGKDFLVSREVAIEEIARKVLDASLAVTNSRYGFVSEIDPHTGWSICRAITGDIFPQSNERDQPIVFKKRTGLWGWVMDHQQPILSNAPREHPGFVEIPPGHAPIHRFLSVPVISGGHMVAQIGVANGARDYTRDDLNAIDRIADLLAIVLERVKLERQLRHAGKLEAIGTLSAGIAHDFNNILGIILGFTEIALLKVSEQDAVHGYLEEITIAGNRAKSLVDQLLTFSRTGDSPRQPMPLAPLVKEVARFLRASLPPTLVIEVENNGDDLLVAGNASQLHQLLINLCTNAHQAMVNTQGKITLTLNPVHLTEKIAGSGLPGPGAFALLQVRDTGMGIAPEIAEHIFDPFFTTKEVGKGTGLGLAVVHGIVANHGGTILLESKPGVGSVFRVYLPLLVEEKRVKLMENNAIPLRQGSGTLLVVDDETQLLSVYRTELPALGYAVVTTENPVQALHLFRENPADFVALVTDQAMPGMTGMELAGRIKAIRPDLPIILCTGLDHDILQEPQWQSMVDRILHKPVPIQRFAEVLGSLLAQDQGAAT